MTLEEVIVEAEKRYPKEEHKEEHLLFIEGAQFALSDSEVKISEKLPSDIKIDNRPKEDKKKKKKVTRKKK